MSATSKISVVSIISWVLGSGLIAFSLNTIYNDYVKQANISLDVNQVAANKSMIDTDIVISNSGMEPAKKIRLTVESALGTIMKPIVLLTPRYYDEDVTIEKLNKTISTGVGTIPISDPNSSRWVVNISNLTNQGRVSLKTFMEPQYGNAIILHTYLRYENEYQRESFILGKEFSEFSSESLVTKLRGSTYLIITLAALAFALPYFTGERKHSLTPKI